MTTKRPKKARKTYGCNQKAHFLDAMEPARTKLNKKVVQILWCICTVPWEDIRSQGPRAIVAAMVFMLHAQMQVKLFF
jgi:hypothetical protein